MGANLNKEFKPRFLSVSAAVGADNTLVTAVAGKRILVLQYSLNAAGGANTITFKSGSTAISGAMDIASDATIEASLSPYGVLQTDSGAALVMNLSAATLVAGHLVYVLV